MDKKELKERLARAFNRDSGGMEGVGRQIVSIGNWLRLHRRVGG
jgi:hypothetical protein